MNIRSLPIDVSRFSGRVVMIAPRPRVSGETGELRPDREGQTVFLVGVAMVKEGTGEAEIIDIQITSNPVGIETGAIVDLDRLEATPWTFEGRSGLAWKAAGMTVVGSAPVVAAVKVPEAKPTAAMRAKRVRVELDGEGS